MDVVLLILAIAYLCGLHVGKWLAIVAIVEVAMLTIRQATKAIKIKKDFEDTIAKMCEQSHE